MKKMLVVCILCLISAFSGCGNEDQKVVASKDAQSIVRPARILTIKNDSGYRINSVHAKNVNREYWGGDILGDDIIPPGKDLRLNLDDGTMLCKFDIQVVLSTKERIIKRDIDVCTKPLTWEIRAVSNEIK